MKSIFFVMVLLLLCSGVSVVGAAETYVFNGTWGSSYGQENGSFAWPWGIDIDGSGNIYVAEYYNSRVQVFNSTMGFLTKWGSGGEGDGTFGNPTGIAVDAAGNVYVADKARHRVQKFTASGGFLAAWGSFGSGDTQFNQPHGVATDAAGCVYVADYGNARVKKFYPNGTFAASIGAGRLGWVQGVAVDRAGNVYVADTNDNRVQKFDSSGAFVRMWGTAGDDDGEFASPAGIAVDDAGFVYVADSGNSRVQKFNSSGGFVARWASQGTGEGQLDRPQGLTIDSTGAVYVADTWINRVQRFVPVVAPVPGGAGVPTNTNGDMVYDDVNGNGRQDFADVVLYFNQMALDRGERAGDDLRLQRQRPDRLRRRRLALHPPLILFSCRAGRRISSAGAMPATSRRLCTPAGASGSAGRATTGKRGGACGRAGPADVQGRKDSAFLRDGRLQDRDLVGR